MSLILLQEIFLEVVAGVLGYPLETGLCMLLLAVLADFKGSLCDGFNRSAADIKPIHDIYHILNSGGSKVILGNLKGVYSAVIEFASELCSRLSVSLYETFEHVPHGMLEAIHLLIYLGSS